MARGTKNFVLTLQARNGGSAPVKTEITPIKAQKVLDMLRRELTRKEVHSCSSVSLEPFFR